MVMSDREGPVAVLIRAGTGIGKLIRCHMNMSSVVIVTRLDQSDGRPVGYVGVVVLPLRQAVQVHGRQEGDAKTDAEMANDVGQISRLRRAV